MNAMSSPSSGDRAEPLLQGPGNDFWHERPGVPRSETGESFGSHGSLRSPRGAAAPHHRKLGTVAVLAIVFFNVSGGPLGSEGLVFYAGPITGLATLLGVGVFFSFPQSLMTAELSSAFPDNGGYSLWVQAAFGDFWAVQESYWSWFSGVVDSALYPVLLYSSAAQLFSSLPMNLIDDTDEEEEEEEGGAGRPAASESGPAAAAAPAILSPCDDPPPLLPHVPFSTGGRAQGAGGAAQGGAAWAEGRAPGGAPGAAMMAGAASGGVGAGAAVAPRVVCGQAGTTIMPPGQDTAGGPSVAGQNAAGGPGVVGQDTAGVPTVPGGPRRLKAKAARPRSLFGCMGDPGSSCLKEYGYKLAVLAAFSLPNCISSGFVGHGLVALGLFVMAPYVVMSALAFYSGSPANLLRPPKKYKARAMLSVAYWSLSGFDCASTFAGEVDQPGRTMPRALLGGCGLMFLGYLVPLAAGAMADPHWQDWKAGALAGVATSVGGTWLGAWVLVSSALSNWGLYASELLEDSFQLLGMAEVGLAPAIFAKRNATTHTPLYAIAFQLVIISLLLGFDFHSIMCVDNFFSAAAAALEFAAAVQLRRRSPDLPTPFRVPLGTAGVAALYAVPFCICMLVCITTALQSRTTLLTTAGALAVGLFLYLPVRKRPQGPLLLRQWDADEAGIRARSPASHPAASPRACGRDAR